MTRLSTFIWILVSVVAMFMLYKVKYEVMALKTQVAETSRELEQKRHALHVAAAEWAYLNRPERLKRLAAKYLASSELTVDQVAEIQDIPFPNRSLASADTAAEMNPVSARMDRQGGGIR